MGLTKRKLTSGWGRWQTWTKILTGSGCTYVSCGPDRTYVWITEFDDKANIKVSISYMERYLSRLMVNSQRITYNWN